MKIGFNPGSIVDLNGSPLVGRVTIYEHDSDIVKDVYTLEGETYTQASNPQLLNVEGRLDDTLYFDASVVDVKIGKYIGEAGQMSVESPDEDFEDFDIFSYGFDVDIATAGASAGTIDELRTTPVASGSVKVLGYYSAGDCSPRLYVWDASYSATEDGGYVIASDLSDSGRWILAYDGETIPCTWYGVRPTNMANISSLLSYPAIVGTYSIRTAPRVFFVAGTYDSEAYTYITTKALAFSNGAKFTGATFKCASVETVGKITDYIADFDFNDNGLTATAHSSWFRSSYKFWKCGACILVYDENNFFATTSPAASETDAAASVVIDDNDRHVFTRKLRIGNLVFIFDEDYDLVKVYSGSELVATVGGTEKVLSALATVTELHSETAIVETLTADNAIVKKLSAATSGGYWTSTNADTDLTSVEADEGDIYLLTNTKDGQIVVTVTRVTEWLPEPFHIHFNMNSGNSAAFVCTQSYEEPGPDFPNGRLSSWSPLGPNIVLTKTTDS